MADTEFDLGEALGGYEQAQADRNFYLSMVQGGNQMASPIAAYLAGVSGVKMATMRQKAQAIEDKRTAEKDAIAATERAQKRADNLDTQIINIMKGARDGSIAPAAAAGMLGYVMKERGYIPKGYDADNNVMTYGVPGDEQDYQFDLGESETSKSQRDLMRIELQKARESRMEREAAANIELKKARTDAIARGKADKNSSAEELRFIKANQDFYDNVWNPKGAIAKRKPLEERLKAFVGTDTRLLNKWLRGVETLDEDAKERVGEYTDLVYDLLQTLQNPNPQGYSLVSNEPQAKRSGSKAF